MDRKDEDITSRLNPYKVIKEIELTKRELEVIRRRENVFLSAEISTIVGEITCISLNRIVGLEFSFYEFLGYLATSASIGGLLSSFYYWLGPKL